MPQFANTLNPPSSPIRIHPDYAGRVFFDMDGVLADFDAALQRDGISGDVGKLTPGFYLSLPAIFEGVEYAYKLLQQGVDVYIATKISHENPLAATEKLQWIARHMPQFSSRVIITPHKCMLSTSVHDVLIDDRPHKAFVSEFSGLVIPILSPDFPTWVEAGRRLEQFLAMDVNAREQFVQNVS